MWVPWTLVKLGKKGQVSIPAAILQKLGLEGGRHLIVELADDGAIVLRPAGIYPIEIYTDERIAEFLRGTPYDPEEEPASSGRSIAFAGADPVFLDANVLFSASLRPRDREYAFFASPATAVAGCSPRPMR